MSKMIYSLVDYNRERSTVALRLPEVNPSVMTPADAGAAIQAHDNRVTDLRTAINNVSLMLPVAYTAVYLQRVLAAPTAAAASTDAQRERKWLVRGFDSVSFELFTFEIPGADLSLLQPNSDYMNITAGAGSALVAALEANMVSKAGNAVEITEIVHVGRNT